MSALIKDITKNLLISWNILNAFSFTPSHSSLRNAAIAMKEYLGIFTILNGFQ